MKKLSIWARSNPVPARWIIVFAQILTVLAGSLADLAFYFRGTIFPNACWHALAGLLLSALFIYPGKGLRGYSYRVCNH